MSIISPPPQHLPAIRRWLTFCIALVVLMVALGGVTRLTESGLSIVEWKLVSGTLPPLNVEGWQAEFAAYQTSPQYLKVNRGFSLADFQQIYWLEYLHRLLGRIIGMAVLLGTLYFGLRGRLGRALLWRMLWICLLVGAQGTVGWIMVASGLQDQPRVAPIKLGLHLLLAFSLFAALLWTRWQLYTARTFTSRPGFGVFARWVLALVVAQVFLGALVAGLRAGLTYNTYPLMDGHWVPPGLQLLSPWWKNHLENITLVQFQHRMVALLVWAATCALALSVRRAGLPRLLAAGLLAAVCVQFMLGVATLLSVVNLWIASAHQLGALLLFGIILRFCYLCPLDANQRPSEKQA